MINSRIKKLIFIVINIYVIFIGIFVTIRNPIHYKSLGLDKPSDFFIFFTNLSNLFCVVTSLLMIIRLFVTNEKYRCVSYILRFQSVVSITLVFLMVVFFLTPGELITKHEATLFSGSFIFFHLITPISVVLSFLLFEMDYFVGIPEILYGVMPMVLYSIFYFVRVIILKNMKDIYNFTFNGRYFLSCISIIICYSVTLLIAFIYKKINNVILKEDYYEKEH